VTETKEVETMTPSNPLVSVIVPCYNYADYVGEALASVLAQDYPNFELVVVDDGSTDDSAERITAALDGWQRSSGASRVEFLQQTNQGVSAALNAGLAFARGEYVATFDADDVMAPGRLRLQVGYLQAHPEVGCVGGMAVRIDQQGELLPKKDKKRAVRRFDFTQALAQSLVVGGNLAVYRRDAMLAVGGYDPSIRVQDFQMTLKIAKAGYFITILPDVVTFYRKHGVGLSSNYLDEYRYGLQVLDIYANHAGYQSGKARLLTRILGPAVIHNKRLAWRLIRQMPLKEWDRRFLKRLRYFFFKFPSSR